LTSITIVESEDVKKKF